MSFYSTTLRRGKLHRGYAIKERPLNELFKSLLDGTDADIAKQYLIQKPLFVEVT